MKGITKVYPNGVAANQGVDFSLRKGEILKALVRGARTEYNTSVGGDRDMRKTTAIDIRDYGAVGDGVTDCTPSIQAAINACSYGETVLVSGGRFLTGALFLKSGIELRLAPDAVLLGSRDLSLYPVIRYPFEGENQWCYASLINSTEEQETDIRITGSGCIDGSGLMLAALQMDTPVVRGRLICIRNCRGVTISGVKLLHPPAWCLHLIGCSDVLIEGVSVDGDYSPSGELRAYADNDDGIVLDSCENVVIRDSEIRTHDDCISIKSGKGPEARLAAQPTRNVTISNCVFRMGSGIAIGSEMSGGIENISISNCRLFDCFSLFCLKTARSRGGYIRHVTLRNCTLESRDLGVFSFRSHKGMIFMASSYKEEASAELPQFPPAEVSDIRIADVRIDAPAKTAVYIHGFAERPFQGIVLSNVRYSCEGPNDIMNAEVVFEESGPMSF